MAQKITKNQLKTIIKRAVNENSYANEAMMISGSGGRGSDMKKFVMFSMNYPLDWIEEIWGTPESKNSVQHMKEKFKKAVGRFGVAGAMCGFYMDLDSENRNLLEEYIRNYY